MRGMARLPAAWRGRMRHDTGRSVYGSNIRQIWSFHDDRRLAPASPRVSAGDHACGMRGGDGRRFGRPKRACAIRARAIRTGRRSEEHTSELQSLMRISYAVFCLKKKKTTYTQHMILSECKEIYYTRRD